MVTEDKYRNRLSINEASISNAISCLSDPSVDDLSQSSALAPTKSYPYLSDVIGKGIYGRETERRQLINVYESVCSGPSQVVFISGESGIGKSALVESLREYVAGDCGKGFFVSGKYDQIGFLEPFSALVAAFSDLVTLIQQSEEMDAFKRRLNTLDRQDVMILSTLIPGLPLSSSSSHLEYLPLENTFSQFKAVCKSFLKVASSELHPVVIFIDDLQWCDEASIKVIRSLLSDLESKHVFMIMTFRNDNYGPFIQSQILDSEKTWPTSSIMIKHFNILQVASMLHSTTGRDYASCDELAKVLVLKTNGNIYYLLQFLNCLEDESVITYMPSDRSWAWDIERILVTTNVADNVAELVASRLNKLSTQSLEVLKIAAALCYEFDFNVLYDIVVSEGLLQETDSAAELRKIILTCVDECFLEKCGRNKYKHSHDRTQTYLYSLIGSQEMTTALHMRIGVVLSHNIEKYPDIPLTFLAADQWNKGSCHAQQMEQVIQLRQLNYLAGKEAMVRQSFHQAVSYFEMYLSLVNGGSLLWSTDYEEAFNFFCLYVKALLNSGEFEKCISVSQCIVMNGKSVQDRIQGYLGLASSLSAQGKNVEATDVCHLALLSLGERMPRNPSIIHVLAEIVMLRRALSVLSENQILALPRMSNPKKIAAMQLLDRIAIQVSMNYSEKNMFVLASHRMAYLSCKYGLNSKSPLGFAFYASILAFGNREQAFKYGELSLKLIDLLASRECESRALTILHGLVFHWRDTFWQTFDGFSKAYRSGTSIGDSESAFLASLGFLACAFFGSSSAKRLEAEIRSLYNALEDLPHELPTLVVHPCLQMTLNLLGISSNRIRLSSEIFDENRWEQRVHAQNSPLLTHFLRLTKLQMAYFFDGIKEMKKQVRLADRQVLVLRPSFLQYTGNYFCGIAYFALYRILQARKYRRKGAKKYLMLRNYFSSGVKSCEGYYYHLDALRHCTLKNYTVSVALFEKAIAYGRETNSILYQALCSESAALMLLSYDGGISREYFMKSKLFWEQWGALAKVEHVDERMAQFFPDLSSRHHIDPILVVSSQRDVLQDRIPEIVP
jgi:predicted ATPase